MPTNQQRRDAAKRKLERQRERRAEQAQRRRRRMAIGGSVAAGVVLVGAVGAYFAFSSSSAPEPPSQAAGLCTYSPSGSAARPVATPDINPPTTGTVNLTLRTTQGAVPLTLDRASAPCAVNAVTSLAQQRFYDGTPCPRLVTSQGLQVLQCGDPTGSGSGGPGYKYAEEPPRGLAPSPLSPEASTYPRGLVAMAKSSQPGSTGSQFFLVYGDSALPPEYSVIGRIDPAGLRVLDRVGAGGDDGSHPAGGGAPAIPVQIQQAVVAAP